MGRVRLKHIVTLAGLLCVSVCLFVVKTSFQRPNVMAVDMAKSARQEIKSKVRDPSLEESANLLSRMKDQHRLVDDYCSAHPELGSKYILPKEQEQRDLLYRHILYDDLREVLFCFVEKIGCTDMKRFMFIAAGVLPEKSAGYEWVELKYLERGIRRASLLNKNLTEFSRLRKINNFFKFTVMRHPLERLVSGFRNKIEPPLVGLSEKFPNVIKQNIFRKYRNTEYQAWLRAQGNYNVSISFPEFVDYFIHSDKTTINPHFKPFIHTCHPCKVRYDFYGNFRSYGSDIRSVSEAFGLSFTWYRNKSLHSSTKSTRELLKRYYDQLPRGKKLELSHTLKDDLDFYYLLYPDETNNHKQFLDLHV